MKKHVFSAFLAVCFVLAMSFFAVAADYTVNLETGKPYESTHIHSIEAEELNDVTVTPTEQNGITLSCILSENKKTINISYSGTPQNAGTYEFSVHYLETGMEKTYTVSFNVTEPVTKPESTLSINGFSPNGTEVKFAKSDEALSRFLVSAEGNGTLSYEWLLNGQQVGTSSLYELVPSSMKPGTYELECIVTNTLGTLSVTSGNESPKWTIVIIDTLKITNVPSAAQIDGTGTVSFTVEAEGENLSYQWFLVKNSENETIKDGKYGQIEYEGANTKTLKITCVNAPSSVTSKFICTVTSMIGETSYTENTGEYSLSITEDPTLDKVKEINVVKKPDKIKYVVGETLDTSGLEIEVVTGRDTDTITTGFACTPIVLDAEGVQTITVSYGGKTTAFTVTVEKATHEHEWSEWQLDETGAEVVYRTCKVDKCGAKEIYSFSDFLKLHPIEAAELGIKEKEKVEEKKEEEKKEDILTPPQESVEEEEKTTKPEKKKNGNGIFWVIIIIALILLAAACVVYVKFYKTPYKKPKKGPSAKPRTTVRPKNNNPYNKR